MKTPEIKIDFSSKAARRRRLFSAKAGLAAFIAVALTFYNIASYLKGRAELGRKMLEAAAIEEKQAFMNAAGKDDGLPDGVVPERYLYWTTFLTRLEERLPDRVALSEVKGASRDNRFFITGGAPAMDRALLFVENLEKDGGFEKVAITGHASLHSRGAGSDMARGKGAVGFSIEAIYRPKGG